MNKIMLVSKVNPQDYSDEKKKVFMALGGMNISSIENKVIDILRSSGIIELKDIVLKYNGIEMKIATQQIPNIIKTLCKENISIYGVYQIYDPDF